MSTHFLIFGFTAHKKLLIESEKIKYAYQRLGWSIKKAPTRVLVNCCYVVLSVVSQIEMSDRCSIRIYKSDYGTEMMNELGDILHKTSIIRASTPVLAGLSSSKLV